MEARSWRNWRGWSDVNIYADLFLTFAKIGVCTFGGGYAMLPILQRSWWRSGAGPRRRSSPTTSPSASVPPASSPSTPPHHRNSLNLPLYPPEGPTADIPALVVPRNSARNDPEYRDPVSPQPRYPLHGERRSRVPHRNRVRPLSSCSVPAPMCRNYLLCSRSQYGIVGEPIVIRDT